MNNMINARLLASSVPISEAESLSLALQNQFMQLSTEHKAHRRIRKNFVPMAQNSESQLDQAISNEQLSVQKSWKISFQKYRHIRGN